MSTKKKNRDKRKYVSLESLEQKAKDYFSRKHYRKAKDAFKELCKYDREKYLPGLIESYKGLAQQMIENGQTSEAKTVIDYIKTLEPDVKDNTLQTQISIKKGNYNESIRLYIEYLSSNNKRLGKKDHLKTADLMVTAHRDFPDLESKQPELSADLNSVRQALKNVCDENYRDALEVIREIKIKSIFSHWKIFLKGLVAFYMGDDEKARNAFEMLPANTVPHNAAKSLLLLITNNFSKTENNNKEIRLISERACLIAGYPEYSQIIPRADYLWRVGRYRDSYQQILDNIIDFPDERPGLFGSLTHFYYNIVFSLPVNKTKKYIDSFIENLSARPPKNDIEPLLAKKIGALYLQNKVEDQDVIFLWEDFINAYSKVYGKNERLEALVYANLGRIFSVVEEPDDLFFMFFRNWDKLRNSQLAIKYFEKSIKLNSNDKDIFLGLLKVYEYSKEKSKFNKLLDSMIDRFPEDKETLLRAGNECINRKAFVKGTRYLEQAMKLDPLDSRAKECLILGYLNLARSYFTKHKVNSGRNTYQMAIELGDPYSTDFNLGQSYIYIRWSAMEFSYGSVEIAKNRLQTAFSMNIQHFPILYFAFLIFKAYNVPQEHTADLEQKVKIEFGKRADPEIALQLMLTIPYIKELRNFEWLVYEDIRVKKFVLDTVKKDAFSRATAKEIILLAISGEDKFNPGYGHKVAFECVKKMLKKDKNDPLFLFYQFMLEKHTIRYVPNQNDLYRLEKILEMAEERNDMELIKDIRQEILSIERRLGDFFKFMNETHSENTSNSDFYDDEFIEDGTSDYSPDKILDILENNIDKELSGKGENSKKKNSSKKKHSQNHENDNEKDTVKRPKYKQLELF